MNIAVFASGSGTNLQAIIDACVTKVIEAKVCVVISNRRDAYALERARRSGISAYYVPVPMSKIDEAADLKQVQILKAHKADLIFLAGYLRKIGPTVLAEYSDRIYNTHPALLPKHGGRGMYGIHVHEAVINAGDKETGITIHRINEHYDQGEIVARTRVPVMETDTAESLAERVLEREHAFVVEVLRDIVNGALS